jgi:alpha,alpha-trehalose phosphorylase
LARTGQSMLNAPEAKSIELMVGDELLRLAPEHPERSRVTDFRREIDFRTGVLRSELTWHTHVGGRVRVVSQRLVSLEHRHLAVLRLSIELLDAPAVVTVISQLVNRQDVATRETGPAHTDPRRSRTFDRRVLEPVLQTHADAGSPGGGTVTLGYRCVGSGMTIAAAYRHGVVGGGSVASDTELAGDRAATTMRLEAAPGETITLTKFVAYHSSSQIPEASGDVPIEELAARCRSTLDAAEEAGWEVSLAEQQAWLDRFWARTDIAVDGDDAVQQAIRWNLFQMAQASAQIGGRGIAAKALTASGYDGHYFWDTEIYMVPLLAYTNPDAARDLLHFRYRTLPTARERAIEMSQRGALYPWRTINGEEASAYYEAGTAQYHIDADIAHAIDRYVTATGDTEFLRDEGAEMLVEIARLFANLGFYDEADPPVFHIHGVTGPDEYTAIVDDNLYTNVMARFTLRFAADVVTRLRSDDPGAHRSLVTATGLANDEVAEWTRAADSMCVLYDAERGINPQDDAFLGHEAWDWDGTPDDKYPLLLNFHPLVIYRHQVLKQADVVLANFLRGDEFELDVQRRNFDYYDPISTGDSSLSACVQSIMASEVGHAELAMRYFRDSLYLDIANTHGNTVDGAHLANVGGVWACLVHGFGGVRDSGTHVRIAPRLPAGWQSMRFGLHRRGGDIAIAVDPTGATVTVESGDPVAILADGVITEVAPGGSLRVAGRAS